MKHLIVCREFPPAPYPPGGIGVYVQHISRLLATRGETVHLIGQRWEEASQPVERLHGGRLVIHRIAASDKHLDFADLPTGPMADRGLQAMLDSTFPAQWFAWRAARLAELLVEREDIDVVEGQEWEAPLYFFLLRRALGLGPRRRPPVITHLHSPTEFIFRHNEWPAGRPDYLPMKRLEDYVIGSADAWLCPSRYLARQCEQRYGLGKDAVAVIPLPVGGTQSVPRSQETWRRGSVCYVGRLEPRKGVLEWVQAAAAVAPEYPEVVFDFLGADLPYDGSVTVRQLAERQIPDTLRDRFRFHGSRPRSEVLEFLAGAQIAVVPSRWENFPNTCVEAMSSGLPVLVTRNGGMVELVEDGLSGWVAEATDVPSDGLAEALRRALATTPATKAQMGAAASEAVRRICDDRRIVEQHVDVRREVVDRGARRSCDLPPSLPWTAGVTRVSRRSAADPARTGVAVVVAGADRDEREQCLATVAQQRQQPAAVSVVADEGYQAALRSLPAQMRPLGILFLDQHDRLQPESLAALEAVLRRCPEIGLVSCWGPTRGSTAVLPTSAPPSFPYQWLSDECAAATLYRAEALEGTGGLRGELAAGFEFWDLNNAVLAAGWAGVTYPAVLAERTGIPRCEAPRHGGRSRLAILERYPQLLALDAAEIIALLEARLVAIVGSGARTDANSGPVANAAVAAGGAWSRACQLAGKGLRDPRRTARWVIWRARDWVRTRAEALGIGVRGEGT